MLCGYAKQGDLEGAGAVCAAMADAGMRAEAATYAALAHAYMLHGDTDAIVRPSSPRHSMCQRPPTLDLNLQVFM